MFSRFPEGYWAALGAARACALGRRLDQITTIFRTAGTLAAGIRRHPDRAAVVSRHGILTFAEFGAAAERLAAQLVHNGMRCDDIVGIRTGRTLNLAVAVFGVMRAGGAFCVLDPADPPGRLAQLRKTGARFIVENGDRTAEPVLRMIAEPTGRAPESGHGTPDSLAYAVFTSGSTGAPKAIGMRRASVDNLVAWTVGATSRLPLRTLQFAALGFDVFFQEVLTTWCSGGTLYLPADEERHDLSRVAELIGEWQIQRLFLPPVALYRLAGLAAGERRQLASLREVIAAGERLRITTDVRALFSRLPGCRLHNHYGPAETHVATAYTLTGDAAAWPAEVPIGVPISNVRAQLVGRDGKPVPDGTAGELHIAGAGLARGYLNAPALTADRFLPTSDGGRTYRTGDLAVRRRDGLLYFAGRTDDQLKIDGYRVEPGEVEARLSMHPDVRECAVTAQPSPSGDLRLVAYVVPDAPVDYPRIRRYLSRFLPSFMIPRQLVTVTALPLAANGKVDRQRLASCDSPPRGGQPARAAGEADHPPATPWEREIAGIWAGVLDVPAVPRNAHFLELGGSSLMAGLVISRLYRSHGTRISLQEFFADPTVRGLAARTSARKP